MLKVRCCVRNPREIQIILKKTKQDFCVLPVIFIYISSLKNHSWESWKPVQRGSRGDLPQLNYNYDRAPKGIFLSPGPGPRMGH